jgi:type IV secretory pathway VirJ component
MGFRAGIAAEVASRIAAQGYPVFGINSFAVFRERRTPEQIGAEVRRMVAMALRGGSRRVILIGQSYGADMVHVALAHMPPPERARIAMVALVVPTDTVYYRVSLGELLEWTAPDAAAIATARRLDWTPVLCIRGSEERESLCPRLSQSNVRKVILPGGHPLHHDADAVARTLLSAFRQAAAPHPASPFRQHDRS